MVGWLRRLFLSSSQNPRQVSVATTTETRIPIAAAEEAPAVVKAPAPIQTHTGISWLQRSDVNAAFTNWLFEGNDYSDMFTNQIEKDILAALDNIVKSKQSGANLVRRMPGVIPQLLQSLRTEDFSGAQLARKISHDVVLVAAVIRIANSSIYNPGKPITSIEHAVLVLGQTGLRQLITSVAFQPIIDLNSGQFTKLIAPRLWEQGEKCAIANRLLAQGMGVDPFEVFLAGLIQNVGLIVSLRVIDQMADGKQPIGSESFCNALIGYGRILSCSIGREWHFPEGVTHAIAEQGNAKANVTLSAMGKTLATGDHLSKMHLLMRHERLPESAALMQTLSAAEAGCLQTLNQWQDSESETDRI